jgi:hypothetical protein
MCVELTNLSETRDRQRGLMHTVACRVEDFLTSCVTVRFSRTILLCGTVTRSNLEWDATLSSK